MVDIGQKPDQERKALAKGVIFLKPKTIELIKENNLKKGDVLSTARIAGIQAAKKTPMLIPLCHTLLLNKVSVDFKIKKDKVIVEAETRCTGKTGVEMEALTAASVACLTIYDMCKAIDKEMEIGNIVLVSKEKK